jgi:hypothetical protein
MCSGRVQKLDEALSFSSGSITLNQNEARADERKAGGSKLTRQRRKHGPIAERRDRANDAVLAPAFEHKRAAAAGHLDCFKRMRCYPDLPVVDGPTEVLEPSSQQLGIEMEFRLIDQEQAVSHPESVDLADEKSDFAFTATQIVVRKLNTGRIKDQLPALLI